MYRQQIPILIFQDKLPLTNRIGDVITEEEPEVDIQQNKISNRIHDGNTYYWSLPSRFLGNQLHSYGGYLTFTIENEAYGQYTPDQDIIIRGNGLTLVWTRGNPLENRTEARFKETEWQNIVHTGSRIASRADLLTVLSNVEAILIRATLREGVSLAHLSDVTLDTAVQQQTGSDSVGDVEICRCPEGYTGTSCEVELRKSKFSFASYGFRHFRHNFLNFVVVGILPFFSHATTSTTAIPTIVPKACWAHVTVAHARMLIHVRFKAMDALYANADQITMENVALVSRRDFFHIISLKTIERVRFRIIQRYFPELHDFSISAVWNEEIAIV